MRRLLLLGLSFTSALAIACETNSLQPSPFASAQEGGGYDADGNPVSGSGSASAPGEGSSSTPYSAPQSVAASYFIGGVIGGLQGSGLVLQLNDGEELPVKSEGTFAFTKPIAMGSSFAVTVKQHPTAPKQTCTVDGGTGTAVVGNVTTVFVNCATDRFVVGGTVSGLAGSGLVLSTNAGDLVPINANGSFALPRRIADSAPYSVTIYSQPNALRQTCTIANGSGSIGSKSVSNIAITCVTNKYSLGGAVIGLSGSGLVLHAGTQDLPIAASGAFVFPTRLFDGTPYAVSIKSNPSSPNQQCSIFGGAGIVSGGDARAVLINCATDAYSIGGTVHGLAGAGLVLQTEDGLPLAINANGQFAFPSPRLDRTNYAVTVKSQPTNRWQTCSVFAGSGNIAGGPVTNIDVECVDNRYSVGGSVSGLVAGGSLTISGGPAPVVVTQDGAFVLDAQAASGTTYQATVSAHPSTPKSQTCSVTNGSGSGNVEGSPINTISIVCTTNTYSIGGMVSGLVGTGLVLKNNNGDDLPITQNGAFTFLTKIESGQTFSVTAPTQPSTPKQTCNVTGGGGSVAAGNVESVVVNCSTDSFTVGGTVSGLDGAGLVLQNNGGADLAINSNGSFSFPAQADLSAYSVSVLTNPSIKTQECSVVANGSGNLAGANKSDVSITCTTKTFAVGGTVSGLGATETVVLQNNGGDSTNATGDGSFTFNAPIASGGSYNASVLTSPAGKSCTVTANGSGPVTNAAISDIAITCTAAPSALVCNSDNFEDGDTADWTFSGTGTGSVTAAAAANGTTLGYQLVGGSGHAAGLRRTFAANKIAALSVWLRPDGSSAARNYVVLTNGAGVTSSVFFLYANGANWTLPVSASSPIATVDANTWTHFEFAMDWTAKTFTVKKDGTTLGTYPFRVPSLTSVTTLDLYNFNPATSQWDELEMTCE